MFITYFKKFLDLFSQGYKTKLFMLFVMSIIAGVLEFMGIALIFPLLLFILNPEKFAAFPPLQNFIQYIHPLNPAYVLSGLIIFAFIIKNIFMVANTYFQLSILKNWKCNLNVKIFKTYLYSTYESKLALPSKFSLLQVWQLSGLTFDTFIGRVLTLTSTVLILGVIVIFLVWKFQVWAIATGLFFVVTGHLQNNFFKTKGRNLVRKRVDLMNEGNKSLFSAIKNIKDIKIHGKEKHFYDAYENYIKKICKIDTLSDFFVTIPANIIELCIIASILIMSFGVVHICEGDPQKMVATLGMLAAAIFRMAPLVNKIQTNLNNINANKPYIVEFFEAYDIYSKMPQTPEYTTEKFEMKNRIAVEDLSFSYGNKKVLSNINIEIKKGEFVGIIGESGVGKTTFVDILMGLLTSNTGKIYADNERLQEKSAQKWINSVGYVPQEITTLPVSIASNIAFGVDEKDIDYNKINEVIKISQLDNYIASLANGVHECLNDLQSLSQGQKQRLGLARALYKDPEVLFLDEITSALDVNTENKITECLNALKGQKTIVAIAHRLSTLKKCDRILYFKSSDCVLSGTFEELKEKDESFAKMIELSSLKK